MDASLGSCRATFVKNLSRPFDDNSEGLCGQLGSAVRRLRLDTGDEPELAGKPARQNSALHNVVSYVSYYQPCPVAHPLRRVHDPEQDTRRPDLTQQSG